MSRLPDWRARFTACLASFANQKFVWGEVDCVTFIGSVVESITGTDPTNLFPRTYTDEQGALDDIHSLGFEDLPSLMAHVFPEVPPALAREGDIAVVETPGIIGHALGIFVGERVAIITLVGYGTVARKLAVRAFRVQ